MASNEFSLVYDGPSVTEGTIDARDLAPALLALADLIDAAAPMVSPPLATVSVRVKSEFPRGSFEILLSLSSLYDRMMTIFSGQEASAWSNLFQILGISGRDLLPGLLPLIKRARGRKPTSVTMTQNSTTTIIFEGDEPITVDSPVWKLFEDANARRAAEKLVSPLVGRGIDSLKVKHDGHETFEVTESEAEYFKAPETRDDSSANDSQLWVTITAPSFVPGNKWRVTDGTRSLLVTIEDPEFMRSVQDSRASFRKDDTLYITMRTTQWMSGGKLASEYSIIKVHEHQQILKQRPMDELG